MNNQFNTIVNSRFAAHKTVMERMAGDVAELFIEENRNSLFRYKNVLYFNTKEIYLNTDFKFGNQFTFSFYGMSEMSQSMVPAFRTAMLPLVQQAIDREMDKIAGELFIDHDIIDLKIKCSAVTMDSRSKDRWAIVIRPKNFVNPFTHTELKSW